MDIDDGQELLATSAGGSAVAAPGSGATITLWSSVGTAGTAGSRYKKIIVNIYSSAASGTNGLVIAESNDGGTNFRTVTAVTVAATTYTKTYVTVSAPIIKVSYTNSANVLTTWEMSVLGDQQDRAAP